MCRHDLQPLYVVSPGGYPRKQLCTGLGHSIASEVTDSGFQTQKRKKYRYATPARGNGFTERASEGGERKRKRGGGRGGGSGLLYGRTPPTIVVVGVGAEVTIYIYEKT